MYKYDTKFFHICYVKVIDTQWKYKLLSPNYFPRYNIKIFSMQVCYASHACHCIVELLGHSLFTCHYKRFG